MSAEGLWTIQFAQTEEDLGNVQVSEEINRGGNLVLIKNKLYGAGISYYFVGTYEETDAGISLTINCTRYNEIIPSQFGPNKEARLVFTGKIDEDTMTLNGHIEDQANIKLFIKAVKKADLD